MTRNPTTTLDQEISVLKRYKELWQVIKPPQDEPSLMAFLKKLLKDLLPLGVPPRTAQAEEEATQIIAKHFHALDPNKYSLQELAEALEESHALAPKVQAIYESYRTELGLRDYARELEFGLTRMQQPDKLSLLADVPCLTPIWAISDLICKLEGLKHKRERETKTLAPQARQGEGKATETPQKRRDVETSQKPKDTLIFDTITGKFIFKGESSVAISKDARARVRKIAIKLMWWWKKGRPCPQRELVQNSSKKTPQGVYNDISTIRGALENIGVNMQQATAEEYPPPSGLTDFRLVSRKTD